MTPTASRSFTPADLEVLCREVVRRAGASEAAAQALDAAERGEPIPEGWANDGDGEESLLERLAQAAR
jgi:LDH2 family malate/lactate/ureidoglycolate dehydrogenase